MLTIIPPVRESDKHGSGFYGASRGKRTHKGVDFACHKGSQIKSVSSGVVTKIGYPYDPGDPHKGKYRYIQVTTEAGFEERYFYVQSYLQVGQRVEEGDVIGESQGIADAYPGMTDHVHFEVKRNGSIINPNDYLRLRA